MKKTPDNTVRLLMTPYLEIDPKVSFIDKPLKIIIKGLKNTSKITLRNELEDDEKNTWQSHATFDTTDLNELDISEYKPIEGTYDIAHPMGLFWSMKQKGDPTSFYVSKSLDSFRYKLSLEVNQTTIHQKTIRRVKLCNEIAKVPVREKGLFGTLFYTPDGNAKPTLLVLSGSSGGLNEEKAALLASYGYTTLALAYFGAAHLPKTLTNIPLEYFESAVDFLKNHPEVDAKRMGVIGTSRGAELALLLSSLFHKDFKTCIAYVPSCVVYPSFSSREPADAWIYRDSSILPSASFDTQVLTNDGKSHESAISLTQAFVKGMEDKKAFDNAMIHVENMTSSLLLISGEDDLMWPSFEYSELILNRLEETNSPIYRKHLHYPKAGHMISLPYYPTTSSVVFHNHANLWCEMGGQPLQQAEASENSWHQVVNFLEEKLKYYQ